MMRGSCVVTECLGLLLISKGAKQNHTVLCLSLAPVRPMASGLSAIHVLCPAAVEKLRPHMDDRRTAVAGSNALVPIVVTEFGTVTALREEQL